MRTTRIFAGATVVVAVGIASLFAAAPASAATLPSGQRITVIDYFENTARYFEASPSTAALTSVGVPLGLSEDELTAVDVNDDGIGYAIGNYYSDGEFSTLYSADANTGTLSGALTIVLDFGDVQTDADYCTALDYSAGVLMAICYDTVDQLEIGYWGILDVTAAPGEAWLTPLYQFGLQEYLYFDSMAVDPVSGLVYAVAYPDGPALYTLSQDAGATFVTDMDRGAFGFDFDRGGQAWVTTGTDGEFPVSALATLNLVDGSNPFIQAMTVDGENLPEPLVQPLTVWGKPALPATGPANTVVLGAGAAALLLLGAFLGAGALARRRSIES